MGEMWSIPIFKNAAAVKPTPKVRWYFSAWLDTSITRYSIPDIRAL